jgi:hypothetical protein
VVGIWNGGSLGPSLFNLLQVKNKSATLAVQLKKTNQKKTAPAFFVLHQFGNPATKSFPADLACGSSAAFLHPASVHAEMVVVKAMRREATEPVPARM